MESKGFWHGRATQTGNPGGCRQIRRLLRLQRHRKARQPRRQGPRLDRGHGHLPFLRAGWTLHLAAENPAHQRLQLRLPLLRQPRLQQRAARPLHRRRGGQADARLLSPQLHRGIVSLLRHHPQRRLHHGAGGQRRAQAARGASLPRLHPSQDHSGSRRRADRGGRQICRPSQHQHRSAGGSQPRQTRAGKRRARDPPHHGPAAFEAR